MPWGCLLAMVREPRRFVNKADITCWKPEIAEVPGNCRGAMISSGGHGTYVNPWKL
jgi:hypothetical protein